MLNLLGFGEHSGNGVPDIFSIWEEAGLAEPVIEEHFGEDGPNKTVVILPLVAKSAEKKATKKSDEKKRRKKDYTKNTTADGCYPCIYGIWRMVS